MKGIFRVYPEFANKDYRCAPVLALLAALAVLPYLPALAQPLISDDYLQIYLGRKYGAPDGWAALAGDVLYRSRATSLLLTWITERLFGLSAPAFYATGILLHVLNTWLVYALGLSRRVGWEVSAFAAGFFGIYLGHQEAIMWYSALPELLTFFFVLSALLAWTWWVRNESYAAYGTAVGCTVLGLLSKEPAVVIAPLALLIVLAERGGMKKALSAVPLFVIAGIYTLGIFAARAGHLHFNDGTFSLHAPFWITWTNSIGRMLWIWGFISLAAITACREWPRWRRMLIAAAVWAGITLLPFSFLTYMPRVPSRHTYLPSAALGFLVAAGFFTFRDRVSPRNRWVAPALAGLILAHHVGYIWLWKRPQFIERAEPTEQLIELARQDSGPIYIHCFPYGQELATLAIEVGLNKPASMLVWAGTPVPPNARIFCPLHHGGVATDRTPARVRPNRDSDRPGRVALRPAQSDRTPAPSLRHP